MDWMNEEKEKETKKSFSEYVADNKVFFTACGLSLVLFVALVFALVYQASSEILCTIGTLLFICVVVEKLFNPLNRY